MDAGDEEVYNTVKGIKKKGVFQRVVENIRRLTHRVKELDSKCDVCYKYLLHPINSGDILKAAKLAKELGVRHFHVRPVGWDNLVKTADKDRISFDKVMDSIDEQLESAMELGDENFEVFGIRHKFQSNFQRKVAYSKCWAAPLLVTFGADGLCYLCCDLRGRQDMMLCSHYPEPSEILKFWNTDRHREMLDRVDVTKCPRCTFEAYNEIIEKVFIQDEMCKNFP